MTASPQKGAVYVLEDPRLEGVAAVGYVGWTGKPAGRLAGHLSEAQRGQCYPVYGWIRSLLADGVSPTLRVVEEGTEPRREDDWVAYYRDQGAPLHNGRKGGVGCFGGYSKTAEYPHARPIRLADIDVAILDELIERSGGNAASVIRGLIREEGRRLGIVPKRGGGGE